MSCNIQHTPQEQSTERKKIAGAEALAVARIPEVRIEVEGGERPGRREYIRRFFLLLSKETKEKISALVVVVVVSSS